MFGAQTGRLPIQQSGPFVTQAFEWTGRLGKQMFEATLEADRFFLGLIFYSIRSRKISDKSGTISQAIHPL